MSTATAVPQPDIIPPGTPEMKLESLALVDQTKAVVKIASAEQYVEVGKHATEVAAAIKRAKEKLDPPCDAAHKAWKAMTGLRAEILDPLEAAKTHDARLLGAYNAEQENLRRQEQERIRREQEDAERARLAREAEEQRLQEAIDLEQSGDAAAATAVLEQPVEVPQDVYVAPVVIQSETPKVAGVSSREKWKVEVVDQKAFIKACADGTIPAGEVYLEIKVRELEKTAGTMKSLFNGKFPGIKAYRDDTTVIRGAK